MLGWKIWKRKNPETIRLKHVITNSKLLSRITSAMLRDDLLA